MVFHLNFVMPKILQFFFKTLAKFVIRALRGKKNPDFSKFFGQKMAKFIGEKTLHG
jgi:hypothetical protein